MSNFKESYQQYALWFAKACIKLLVLVTDNIVLLGFPHIINCFLNSYLPKCRHLIIMNLPRTNKYIFIQIKQLILEATVKLKQLQDTLLLLKVSNSVTLQKIQIKIKQKLYENI